MSNRQSEGNSHSEASLGREIMSKSKMFIAFLAVTLAAPLGFVDTAMGCQEKDYV
jgi:hypothetical protein